MSRRPRQRRRRPVRKTRGVRRPPIRVLLIVLGLVAVLASGALWAYRGPGPAAAHGGSTTVVLTRGSGVARIAETLKSAGVISSAKVFVVAAKLTGSGRSLKAGEYEIPSRASLARILADIREGKVVRRGITIPEGWTSAMAAEAVAAQPELTGPADPPPEGAILPDTYQVERGESRAAVLERMVHARERLLAELWDQRQPGLPFKSPQEAVTLASIVEKETALPAERPRIAAVYINRLRSGMRLESDPTTIYGVSQGRPLGRGLTMSELLADTAYNTYRIDGLPPGPIANPGREALKAVLNPPKTTELFFVANGLGGHAFASSYDEHQRNVARWRSIERDRARQAEAAR